MICIAPNTETKRSLQRKVLYFNTGTVNV